MCACVLLSCAVLCLTIQGDVFCNIFFLVEKIITLNIVTACVECELLFLSTALVPYWFCYVIGRFALGSGRRREKGKQRVVLDMLTLGALVWNVQVM